MNMTLDGLQETLRKACPRLYRSGPTRQVNLVRWADDFIISGRTREILVEEVLPVVTTFLAARGLQLSPTKTRLTRIQEGFDFLGQHVRKYQGRLRITPAKSNTQAMLNKVRHVLRKNRQTPPGELLVQLNPIIRGWAYYHRHIACKRVFNWVDHTLFQMLWRWARRRHPQKSKYWLKDQYFGTLGKRHWVFQGEMQGRRLSLFIAPWLPFKRHTKIRAHANPFDPTWEVYFEQRLTAHMETTLKGRGQLRHLWQAQQGLCPVCEEKITPETGWHNHHLIWRTHGGPDTAENRVLLHPNCHRQVHARKLSVEKPRSMSVGKA